jgi:hypothetical protein
MRHNPIKFAALALSLFALTACPADQAAVDPPGGQPVDMRPDPRIEAAPAYPTPPGEVPIGLEPTDSPRPMVDMDTIPQAGTVPGAPGTTQPGTTPRQP